MPDQPHLVRPARLPVAIHIGPAHGPASNSMSTLTHDEVLTLLQNSIERFLNNAIEVGKLIEKRPHSISPLSELASTMYQDAEDLKPVVCKVWNLIQEAIRLELAQ